ncbi:MAG: CoA transferase [Chitinophagales bacterium]|nr:CoA transferase [Chitinophagales bacterium]MCZ2392328.1 CoA transferase [Chitinophagales bacterium]
MERPIQEGPLKGIRILDLSRLLPGPLATQMLADMGAEVIKVEDPKAPDYARYMAPHYHGQGISYLALNRSKQSLAIDLGNDSGKQIFWNLLKTADIVIDSFRPGVLNKLGIDYQTAIQYKEDIIYVSVTGYGHGNLMASKAGHDINYLGHAGVLATNGTADKILQPGVQISDIAGGSYPTVMACLAALLSRNSTGKGQFVDVAMVDCSLPLMSFYMAETLNTNKSYQRQEHALAGSLPNYNIYQCKDRKWMALGSLEPKFWAGFCMLINKPEWANRIFDTNIHSELEALFLTKDRDEWAILGASMDICLTPILEMDELEKDNYLQERGMFVEHEHAIYGQLKGINQPIKFYGTPSSKGWAPPLMGEDNENILQNLGYSEHEILELKNKGVIIRQEK